MTHVLLLSFTHGLMLAFVYTLFLQLIPQEEVDDNEGILGIVLLFFGVGAGIGALIGGIACDFIKLKINGVISCCFLILAGILTF